MDTQHGRDFDGKVAFITGAANGIGRAAAVAFARRGADVVIADIADTSDTVKHIEAVSGRALARRCDVTDEDAVRSVLDEAVGTFGRLDFAFNNAGMEQPITATADIGLD